MIAPLKFLSENGRQDNEPGAEFAGTGSRGIAPRENHRVVTMDGQSTNGRGTLAAERRGSLARDRRGIAQHSQLRNLYAENSHHSSALCTLTTQELTKEVQCMVLGFPTREVVEDTQASLRAIENIRNGDSGMSLKTFVNLCRRNPRARAMVAPMLGYGLESDPNVVQALSVLLNELVRPDAVTSEVSPRDTQTCAGEGIDPVTGDLFDGDGN